MSDEPEWVEYGGETGRVIPLTPSGAINRIIELEDALRDLLDLIGVVLEDERIPYVVANVDRKALENARRVLGEPW